MSEIKKSQKLYNIQWYRKGELSAQDYLISIIKKNEILLHRYTTKEGRQWGITTPDNLAKITNKNRFLYEVVLSELKRKLFFDVDCDRNSYPDIIASDLLEQIKAVIETEFPGAILQISGSVTDTKISYHIIISNYIADTSDDMLVLKNFAERYSSLHFDVKVYTSNRLMKLINQSKPDLRVQYHIFGDEDRTKHFITCFFDVNSININTSAIFKEQIKLEDKDDNKFNLLEIPQLNMTLPELFDWNTSSFFVKLNIIPLFERNHKNTLSHNNIKKIMIWCKQTDISFEEFWNWNLKKENSKIRLQKWFEIWSSTDLNIGVSSIEAIVKRFYPKITENKSTMIFKRNFNIESEQSNKILVDSQFLNKDSINNSTKYTILCSPMGSNKTGAIVENLNSEKVLWITPRITLSENTLKRLNDDGYLFSNYKDYTTQEKENGKLEESGNVICSIQSLHYLQQEYSTIIVDEIETVLNTFNENCMTHGKHCIINWMSLKDYLLKAKNVYLMDAFTTKLTTEMIRQVEPHQVVDLVYTSQEANPRFFNELESFNDWVFKIKEALQAKKKIYVFTPYKNGVKGVETISNMLIKAFGWQDNKQIISYHSGKTKEKKALYNCDKIWGDKELRCIITNSCITVGVNFNTRDIFDEVFCFYSPSIAVRDFIQGITRVRHPKSNIMNIYMEKTSFFKEYLPKAYDEPNCEIFKTMKVNLDIERKANQNNFETLYFLCEKANIKFLYNRPEHTTEVNRKEIKRLLEETNLSIPWDDIKTISYDEMNHIGMILNSNLDTLQLRLEFEKYHFSTLFSDQEKAKLYWDSGKKNFVEKINILLNNPNHIINSLYKNNDMKLNKPVKSNPILGNITLSEIQEDFKFHNQPKDNRIDLIMKMINAFFETKVVSLEKAKEGNYKYTQVTINDKKYLKYTTSKTFLGLINQVIDALTVVIIKPTVKLIEPLPTQDEQEIWIEDESGLEIPGTMIMM